MCSIVGCKELSVYPEPVAMCEKHYREWELIDAQDAADRASAHLAKVQRHYAERY